MFFYKNIALFWAICSTMAFSAPHIWDGSADTSWYNRNDKEFTLTTPEQLAGLAQLVNSGNSFISRTIFLGADIFLNDTTGAETGVWNNRAHKNWTPIGTRYRPFRGNFDGCGYNIYGLYINDASKDYVGLWGYSGETKISNLNVLVGRISARSSVGSIIGYMDTTSQGGESVITNVCAKIKVSGVDSVGGLIGLGFGVVKNSSFIGDVTGRNYIGGIIGETHNLISKSYAKGNVDGRGDYVGGIVGYSVDDIDSVYHADGDVVGMGMYVGGIAGSVWGNISDSHSEGDVTGSGDYIGGIVGKLYGLASGEIVRNSYSIGNIKGGSYVGGLVGLFYNYLYNDDGSKTWIIAHNSYSVGNVKGENYVGGLVGLDSVERWRGFKTQVYDLTRKIVGARAYGSVEGNAYVGGLAGGIKYGDDFNSPNSFIAVADSCIHSGGVVTGKGYVGGLFGYTYGSVSNSRSEGDVIESDAYSGWYIGGLIGKSTYYYDGSRNQIRDVAVNSYAIGNVKGYYYVGGAIGGDSLYVESNTNYTLIRRIVAVHTFGTVEGTGKYVGGIAGLLYSMNTARTGVDSCSHTEGDVKGSAYVGGLLGLSYGPVSNSRSEGDVSGGSYVGGLLGLSYGSVSNSRSEGDVSGGTYIGGLVGSAGRIANSRAEGRVTGRSNYIGGVAGYSGVVDSSSHIKGDVSGNRYVGGLVGYANNFVSHSFSMGDVYGTGNYVGGLMGYGTGVSKSYAEGRVKGDSNFVGGITGYAIESIDSVHHIGDVTGNRFFVGGLVGLARRSKIRNATKNDTTYITNSYSIGNIKGKRYVGGLVGADSLYRYLPNTKNDDTESFVRIVSGNISKGRVEGEIFVGGLIGSQSLGSDSSNKRISNMKIITQLCSHSDGGVFADSNYVGGLIGATVSVVDSAYHVGGVVKGKKYVGGLIGFAKDSVSHSYSKSNVVGSSSYIGGLVGYEEKIISNSYAEGNVISDSSWVGGIAGNASYRGVNFVYHRGDVIGDSLVGGLVGYGSVLNSYSEGNVVGKGNYVGGLAGGGNITRSNAKGSVFGLNYIGGLVGAGSKVKLSYFVGDSVIGVDYVGGLIGRSNGYDIDSSYSVTVVKGSTRVGGLAGVGSNISNSYAVGNVIGDSIVGGLIGAADRSITKSMALGNVSGITIVGGLVGSNGGEISQSYAHGNVTGNSYIGGLVGYAKGTLREVYASGNVESMEGNSVYMGCIVGYVNGSLNISKSYYDRTICNIGVGGDGSASVVGEPGKTTIEMQTQTTFDEWNFVDTWQLMGNSYPFLRIYATSLLNAIVTTECLNNIIYDGIPKTPQVLEVSLNGEILREGVDFSIEYKNNKDAGTAWIDICGMDLYNGCKNIGFDIQPLAIKPSLVLNEQSIYTGMPLTPEVLVYNGNTLLSSADYIVEYENNLIAGTAVVLVTARGNYSGSVMQNFIIEKAVPEIVEIPFASDVLLNETLASSELSGGLANTDGLFVWKSPETYPKIENNGYVVTFVPSDTSNYESIELVVPIKVWDVASVIARVGNVTIDSVVLVKGSNYILPEPPDSTGYDFVGFYEGNGYVGNTGESIVVNENTIIKAIYAIKKFVVKFVNDGAEMQSGNVAYGTAPTYNGVEPSKPATAQFTYTFKGWSPTIVPVTDNATYTAVFDSSVNKYDVMFTDYKGMVLSHSTYAYGTDASQISMPDNQKRESTVKYIYSFKGWTPSITSVTDNVTYTAVFDSTLRKYSVSFVSDGSVLETVDVAYGETPKYSGKTPTKPSTKSCSYEFVGWSPRLGPVEKDVKYTAVFDSTVITGIVDAGFANQGLSVEAVNRNIHVSEALIGEIYVIFDMQGRVLRKGRVDSSDFNITMPIAGNYLVKIGYQLRRVNVR